MRIGNVQPGRPAYYDRNAVPTSNTYAAQIGPHAAVTRWVYTVPSGKKAFVEHVLAQQIRTGAAAPVGVSESIIGYVPFGGSPQTTMDAVLITNAVGERDHDEVGSFGMMSAGDTINGTTSDPSTGGLCIHFITEKHTEFDA